jgi:hypothetical protein
MFIGYGWRGGAETGTYAEACAGSPNTIARDAVDSSFVDVATADKATYISSVSVVLCFPAFGFSPNTYLESTYATIHMLA